MEIIDWIIRVVGLISIFSYIVGFLIPKKEYSSDVKIKQINNISDIENLGLIYYHTFEVTNESFAESFIITPNGVDLKNVTFHELEYDMKHNKLIEKKILREFKMLENNNGILVKTILPEGIPSLKISWRSSYGLRGEYIFQYNGFNGNVNLSSYKYRYTFITKLRFCLRLK